MSWRIVGKGVDFYLCLVKNIGRKLFCIVIYRFYIFKSHEVAKKKTSQAL